MWMPFRISGVGIPRDTMLMTSVSASTAQIELIFSGAFDKYPKLRLVIGHAGEAMPLLLYRFDWMQSNADGRPGRRGGQPPVKLKHQGSHYFHNNIWVTTRGVKPRLTRRR